MTDKAPKQSQVEFQLLIEGKFINNVQFSSIKVSFSDDSTCIKNIQVDMGAMLIDNIIGYDFEVAKEDLLLEANKHKIISKWLQTNTESVVEVKRIFKYLKPAKYLKY